MGLCFSNSKSKTQYISITTFDGIIYIPYYKKKIMSVDIGENIDYKDKPVHMYYFVIKLNDDNEYRFNYLIKKDRDNNLKNINERWNLLNKT